MFLLIYIIYQDDIYLLPRMLPNVKLHICINNRKIISVDISVNEFHFGYYIISYSLSSKMIFLLFSFQTLITNSDA